MKFKTSNQKQLKFIPPEEKQAWLSVHSVLRESLRFGNISVPGSDRMDNLPKVHT
jgi:hypothetical protein